MSNVPTIHNARDYVNYVFNISTRGVTEVTSEIFGLSSTVQNVLGNLAFKTSEYLSHAEATTVGFGIAAAGAYVGATKRAIEFQQATANVEAISGKQLIGSEVGAQAMEMSSKFGMAIEDMTSGLESLARAGVTAKSSIDALLESGTQMAKFEGTDLETSMNDLISTVNLLTSDMDVNSEAYAKRVADVNQHIISTSESSPINAHDIINSLQHVGGYASSTNLDQDDLFAVIAQLGSKGTKGEITGTSLRAFISAGQKDTAQRALNRVGLNVTDLWDETGESILSISQMKDVLDDALEAKGYSKQQKLEFYSDFVGYKQANQIMKIDTSEVEHYRSAIDNAMNLTDKMNITLGTVQGNWSQIVSTGVNFMTKVGSKMLPIINAILIPIKMIVGFLDKMPFADWIVGAGLGFVAIKGIAKAVQILVPTMLTFIYKFTDLKKDSFSIRNIFEQWVEDLKQARSILMSMRDKDEMEKIVDEREAEHTNKYLSQLNEKDAINEYMRQKFGTRTTTINGRERTYYKWDQMSETQREYYRNKYRPSEDIIKKFIDHRKKWFEDQWANADDTWEPSSGEWPRGNSSTENNDSDFGDDFNFSVLSYCEEFVGYLHRIAHNFDDLMSNRSSTVESNGVNYNPSNRERNARSNENLTQFSQNIRKKFISKKYQPAYDMRVFDDIMGDVFTNEKEKEFFDNTWGKKTYNRKSNAYLRRLISNRRIERTPFRSMPDYFYDDAFKDISQHGITLDDVTTKLGDSMWNSGTGLPRPVVLYRRGRLNTSSTGLGVLTGITSTAYDPEYAESYNSGKESNMRLKIYAPTGTKGFDNDGGIEYTLPPNYPYVELERSYNEAKILLLTLKQIQSLGFNPRGILGQRPYRLSGDSAISTIDHLYNLRDSGGIPGIDFKQTISSLGEKYNTGIDEYIDKKGYSHYFMQDNERGLMPITNPKDILLGNNPHTIVAQDIDWNRTLEATSNIPEIINSLIDAKNIYIPPYNQRNAILSNFMPIEKNFGEKRDVIDSDKVDANVSAGTQDILNILNGTIGSTILSDLSDYQMIKNRTSVYDPRDRKVPDSIDDVIKNLEDYYKYGRFYIYNKNSSLGESQSSEGRFIRINAKKLSAYDDSNAIQTIIHELAHMTLSPYERKANADGKTLYNPDASRSGDKNYRYDTKENHIGTEAEANIAQIITAQMLGEEGNLFGTKGRMNWMLYQMDDSEDINLDLINPLVNEAINNTEAVFSPMVKALREFNGSKHLKEKANKVADDIQKYIDASKENNLILEDYRNQGVDFSDISVSARDLYGVKKSQDFGRRKSATAADVFNLSQGTAASRIVAEKERIKQKMDEFQNNKDVIFNAYKKNIVTSAMTEDGRKFAKEKNQRQLFDFLNHGLENVAGKDPSKVQNYFKGGIFNTNDGKTQWDMIQDYFSNAEIEYREGKWKDDDFLQSFGGLSPDEFLNKYQGLTREADKMRVMNALLQFGDFSADRIMHTREVPNRDRRNLITNTDYENISQQLGIDFSSASNKEEKHAILRDWLKNNSGREDEVTSILMEHEDVLAKTMESSSHNANLKFLQALQASGQYDVSDLLTDFMSNSQYSHFKLYDKLKKEFFLKDENGNYLSDEQQPLLQFSKQFWGDWATFGKAAQYELSIHFAEIEKLAQRAEVTVNDFNADAGTSSGGSDGGPSSGPSSGSDGGPSGSSDDGASDDISDERREQIKPQMERLQAFVDKFYAKIFDVSDSLFGKHVQPEFTATSYGGHIPLDTTNYIPPTNRVTKFLYDKLKDVDSNAFTKQIDKINDKIDESKDYLELWRDAFNEVGKVFPPFIAAGMALQGVIEGLTIVTTILTTVESGLANMRKLEGVFSIFKNTKLGDNIKTFGEGASRALTKVGGMISNVVTSLASSLVPLAPIILPIVAAILAVVAALKLSQDAHDKYLEKLKKEQKEVVSEDKANQALYESARKQRRAGYRNKAAKNFGDIQYDVAQQKLHASNLKRQINARKVAEQESDALWGTYGERARLQKMDWGQSIGAYIIPFVGTIAKAMAGEFKSTASEYTGSTEQIRQIKESTINNPRATGSQKMVAAYFDANQAQLSMIDNYKSELGELYDTESKLIRMYGSKESARNSALFKKSVEEFAEKVGIDVETAKKMLDYMQVEHNVETASTAMKAQADSIVNETEQKALAAANGADMDILLNGSTEEQTKLMVQAQADSIKQQAADSLWWKAVWSSFSAMFWQAVSPLTLIYNILTYIWYGVMALVSAGKNPLGTLLGNNQELNNNLRAMDVSGKNIQNSLGDMIGQGPEAKKARMYMEGYNTIQNEDLYSKGMSSVSDLDRANYGNGGGSLSSPNVVPATPKDYQEDTTNTTNTESKTTSQSTSWWDTLFKPQNNTVTQKASTKTASAQTETSKAQAYQQKYDNNLHAIDWYARNSIGDMIGQSTEAKRAQAYQQGYDKIQKVEVTNQDDSVALQSISNEIIGVGAVGLIAKRYNIGGTVGDISSTLKLLSKSNIFTQGVDLIKSIVKHTKNIGTPASNLIKNIAKTLGITGKSGAKALAGKGTDVLKDTLEQAAEALDKVEKLNDIKEAYHEHGVKGVLKSGWEKIKGSERYNKLKDFILGKEVTKPTGRVKVGIDAPNEPIMATTREGGLLSKIKSIPKTLKDINKIEGLKGLYSRGANKVKGLSPYSKAKDLLLGKEVTKPTGRVKVGIDAPNEPIMATTREGGVLSKIKGGIQDINVKDLWSRGKTGGKEVLRAASKDVGGWEGLLSTTKSGMIETMNPRTAVTGLKEMGAGLKGGGTLLKGASKVAGPAAAVLGGALTFMEEYEEHDPSKTHYNEDGTEKKAFQSAGEVAGSTVGSVAGGLGGAILGAEAGAALGTAVAGPIGTAVGGIAGGIIGGIVGEETMRQWGDAIGGTLGWVGDQLWNLVPEQGKAAWNTITKFAGDAWDTITKTAGNAWESITGTLSGFGKWLNDATGGVSGQIWDTLVGTNEQSDRLVKGALGYTPIGAGINLASDVYNWLTGSGDNTNTSSYQPQTAEATQKGVEEAQKNKRTQGTKTSIVIENININTEDDPEKIKTALMNLIIELQEQVSPRMVSRTIGEPAQASSDTEEDSKTKEEEEALKKQQSGSSTTTTLS